MSAYTSTLELDRQTVKQNDTYPPIIVTLSDSEGPVDLSTAETVTLVLRGNTSSTLVTSVLTTENMHAGAAQYAPGNTDLDTPDVYQAEAEIVWSGGGRQTVPNDYATNPTLTVAQQLNPTATE